MQYSITTLPASRYFSYKLKSVVYNALLRAGKLPLMVESIYNTKNVTAGKFVGSDQILLYPQDNLSPILCHAPVSRA